VKIITYKKGQFLKLPSPTKNIFIFPGNFFYFDVARRIPELALMMVVRKKGQVLEMNLTGWTEVSAEFKNV